LVSTQALGDANIKKKSAELQKQAEVKETPDNGNSSQLQKQPTVLSTP
jgi:hypothetical protein